MAMGFGMMELLMLLLSGGGWGNDLLDYLPTNAYWRLKGVEVSVERMTAELAVGEPADLALLIRDLGAEKHETREAASARLRTLGPIAIPALRKAAESDDPEVRTRSRELLDALKGGAQANAVRRLMAIRTLAELKKPEAAAALRPLLEAKEPFVADYAARAIAAIDGKPHIRPQATKEQAWSDLCLLPANCGIVAQLRMPGGQATSFEEALKAILPQLPAGADVAEPLNELAKGIASVAEQVGNIRLDTLTLGVADNVGDNAGFAVVVARGRYDAAAVRAALAQSGMNATRIGGLEVFAPPGELRLIPCSNDRFVLTGGPSEEQLPVKEIAAALQSNADKLALRAKMAELIATMDREAAAWAAVVMSDTYRQAPFLTPFDTITATGKNAEGGVLHLTIAAAGNDPEAVKGAVATIEKGVKGGLAEVQQHAGEMPFVKPIVEFMQSIRIETADAKATLTARLKGQGAALMMPMMFLFSARGGAVPPDIEAIPEPPQAVPDNE